MDNINVTDLVQRLGSDEDSVRKMAVFKLQSAICDPSFADIFMQEGGLAKLRSLCLGTSGNTLAYSLTSFSRVLELDKGWEYVTPDVIERAVQLVVTQPLVNILRSAVSLLVAIVSHPQTGSSQPGTFGFRALKPAVTVYPQFLEMLVSILSSAEHLLCANALQLINSLMRDAVTTDSETEWPKFIKKLQDLGVIKAVYVLMQSTALPDLAHPILEFQSLTKVMLRKWRELKVDFDKQEHRRALRNLHNVAKSDPALSEQSDVDTEVGSPNPMNSYKKDPERWRRLGFETESPAWEFVETGFLGMMDLTDFAVKNKDAFKKLILEQSTKPVEQRCPIARASLAVTLVLYEHFEIDKSENEDAQRYAILESRSNFEKAFRPLLLHWSRLHTACLGAFLRLWKATGAETEDFEKVEELLRILTEQVVGQAPRTKDIGEVEEELGEFEYQRLRDLQMELLELTYEDAWGHHLRQVREELNHEALQFVKEQRIRCLLQGAWFPHSAGFSSESGPVTKNTLNRALPTSWRFVRLSHNRRYLHYADFEAKTEQEPTLDNLLEKIDLSMVSFVVSNVSASPPGTSSSSSTLRTLPASTSTRITIHGFLPHQKHGTDKESVLLQLNPQSHTLASEWLDGLLMLLNQQPITADTNKLVDLIGVYGLKIRLLNVRFEDLDMDEPAFPGREGLDEDYWYDIGGMEAPS